MKLESRAEATLLLACLVACGGSKEPGTASPAERSEGGTPPLESADARGDTEIAGGETSEFSGDIGSCALIVSNEPLDLTRADWAPWVALVEGRHELTLGWRRLFEVDTVT